MTHPLPFLLTLLAFCWWPGCCTSTGQVEKAVQFLIDEEPATPCLDCGKSTVEHVEHEDVVHQLRLDHIKKQILKKLQLEQVPNVVRPVGKLPVPLTIRPQKARPVSSPYLRDIPEPNYYGLTNQFILLSQSESTELCISATNPSTCFRFTLPKDTAPEEVSSAELWVYKHHDFLDGDAEQSLIYYELRDNDILLLKQHSTQTEEGWIKLNITKEVRGWLHDGNTSPLLEVECPSCGYGPPWIPISLQAGQQPLLVVNVDDKDKKKRHRRNINCRPGVSECCREKLYVSFKDTEYNWILEPDGYDAYYCTGSCTNAPSLTTRSLHSTYAKASLWKTKRVELVPCCSPTSHADLQVIYMVDNKTVVRNTLPNMIVQSCGCM